MLLVTTGFPCPKIDTKMWIKEKHSYITALKLFVSNDCPRSVAGYWVVAGHAPTIPAYVGCWIVPSPPMIVFDLQSRNIAVLVVH